LPCLSVVLLCMCQEPTFVTESSDQKKLFDCRNLSVYWDTNMAGDVESGPELVVRASSLSPSLLTPNFPPHSQFPSSLPPFFSLPPSLLTLTFPPHSHLPSSLTPSLLTPTFPPHSHLPSSLPPSLLAPTFLTPSLSLSFSNTVHQWLLLMHGVLVHTPLTFFIYLHRMC